MYTIVEANIQDGTKERTSGRVVDAQLMGTHEFLIMVALWPWVFWDLEKNMLRGFSVLPLYFYTGWCYFEKYILGGFYY